MAAQGPSARPVEGASERTWWASPPWFRKFVPVWFALTLFFLGYLVLVSEDVPTGTMISAVINPVVAAVLWTAVRQRTRAGADGLTVVGAPRTRSLPWEHELHLIAVDPNMRGRGVGQALVERICTDLSRDRCKLLSVHTVGPSFDSESYAATRYFYESAGFHPLEEHSGLDWSGPSLIFVKVLDAVVGH